MTQAFDLKRIPLFCAVFRKWLCPCFFGPFEDTVFDKERGLEWRHLFNKKLDNIVASGRYNDRDDFTVVIQPTFLETEIPRKNGIPDLDYLAPDCFHWGQRSHALGI